MPPRNETWVLGEYIFTLPNIPTKCLEGKGSNVKRTITRLVERRITDSELLINIQSDAVLNQYVKSIHRNGTCIFQVSTSHYLAKTLHLYDHLACIVVWYQNPLYCDTHNGAPRQPNNDMGDNIYHGVSKIVMSRYDSIFVLPMSLFMYRRKRRGHHHLLASSSVQENSNVINIQDSKITSKVQCYR